MAELMRKRNSLRLEGVWVPVVTPFRDGRIDGDSFARLLDHLRAKGVSGVVVAGTTGESSVLSDEERLWLTATAVRHLSGSIPVLAGVAGADTRRTVELARRMENSGADGILSVVPYYNCRAVEGRARSGPPRRARDLEATVSPDLNLLRRVQPRSDQALPDGDRTDRKRRGSPAARRAIQGSPSAP